MAITDEERDVLRVAARQELARRRLLDYAMLVDNGYVPALHAQYLCGVLEALERDEIQHLIVLVPPRHGKTRLISQIFPAWWLGRHPSDELILASNTSDLAGDNGGRARDLLAGDRTPFDVRISSDTAAKSLWRTTSGGVCRAAGVGSAIQGRGGNLLICDDPIAGAEEATATAFERQWEWFSKDFFPRRLSRSHVVLSMFRWGDLDLAGRILMHEDENFRKQWTVVSLPAYAREKDPFRVPGEVLWPPMSVIETRDLRGYGRDFLETQRGMNSKAWQAQYELDPVPDGGLTFKPEWFTRRYRADVHGLGFTRVMSIDGAWKTGLQNDRSAIATWATDGVDYYLLDVWAGRVEFPDLRDIVKQKYMEWRPRVVLCEEAASGFALVQELRRYTGIPIIGLNPKGSKEARAEAATPLFESSKVLLPERAPWLDDWLQEHLRFPAGKHDDLVDTTSLALSYMHQKVIESQAHARWVKQNEHVFRNWMAR